MPPKKMIESRLRAKLVQQRSFIENSCKGYDGGNQYEAIRIATCLRVLFHNTKTQVSLLVHLNAPDVLVLSTCGPPPCSDGRRTPLAWDGLAGFSGAGPIPKLGNSTTKEQIKADTWWNQSVLMMGGKLISRKDIVLNAADKDGGAHVDKTVSDEYAALDHGVWQNLNIFQGINCCTCGRWVMKFLTVPQLVPLLFRFHNHQR